MKALNRIVTALLAAAIFPVAYFTDIITVYAHANLYDSNIVEALSIKRIVELFTGDGLFAGVFNKDNMSEIPEGLPLPFASRSPCSSRSPLSLLPRRPIRERRPPHSARQAFCASSA